MIEQSQQTKSERKIGKNSRHDFGFTVRLFFKYRTKSEKKTSENFLIAERLFRIFQFRFFVSCRSCFLYRECR